MGFRTGSYAKVWEVSSEKDTRTRVRISISRKNKSSGEYEQDFGGFVDFIGTATAKKALGLRKGDRIKLGDCDVSNHWDKERGVTYTNFKVFNFELDEDGGAAGGEERAPRRTPPDEAVVDDGDLDDDRLPF